MPSSLVIAKWSIEDYHRMIEAGIVSDRRIELLRGEIIEMAPEGKPHAHLSSNAADYIREVLRGKAKVREEKPITLPNNSEPEPDIAIVRDLGDIYLDHHPFSEDIYWLIEYADASLSKDLEVKSQIYAEAGIQEYWVVNLKQMTLIVFKNPDMGRYQSQQKFTGEVVYTTAFPEVALDARRFIRR